MNLFPFDIMTNVLFLSLPIFSTAQLVHVLTVAVVESGLPASSNKDVKLRTFGLMRMLHKYNMNYDNF